MAKRRSKTGPAGAQAALTGVEETIVDFAGDLGRILGTTQRKASDWIRQRQTVIKQLEGIRSTAEGLLGQLGSVTAGVVRRGRKPGRSPESAAEGRGPAQPAGVKRPRAAAKRKRPAMTAEQRKAVGERMRKYWAARRKTKK